MLGELLPHEGITVKLLKPIKSLKNGKNQSKNNQKARFIE